MLFVENLSHQISVQLVKSQNTDMKSMNGLLLTLTEKTIWHNWNFIELRRDCSNQLVHLLMMMMLMCFNQFC